MKGTKYNRTYFQLVPSTLRTEGTEFGLLHTQRAILAEMSFEMANKDHKRFRKNDLMNLSLLPTPTSQEPTSECEITHTGRRKTKDGKNSHSLNLGRVAGLLPTPNASNDWKGGKKPETYLAAKQRRPSRN
jgi:hypothetical protein